MKTSERLVAGASLSNPLAPFAMGVAVLGIALLALLFSVYLIGERETRISYGEVAAEQIAGFTAISAEGRLDSLRQMLRGMAVLANQAQRNLVDRDEVRKALLEWKSGDPYVMDLLILSADGRINHWTGPGPVPDVSDRSYYRAHAEHRTEGLHVADPMLSRVHAGRWFFALSEGLRDELGELRQVVVAILDAALMRDRIAIRLALPESSQALLGADGMVYMRTPAHDQHIGKRVTRPAEFAQLTAKNPIATFHRTSQLDGRARILSFRKVAGYPLIAAGTIDVHSLLQPWRVQATALALLWVALSAAIVWFTVKLRRIGIAQAELAGIDSLTGTYNRRTILSAGSRFKRSHADRGELSLLMIDVDHFKSINDRFGHAVGDEVLRQLSTVLRDNVRGEDIVGRYGGEEFLVLMPDTGEEGARSVAEKLRARVEASLRKPMALTISIGVATTSEADLTLDKTLAAADAALYAAKDAGRNCVRVYSELARSQPRPAAG